MKNSQLNKILNLVRRTGDKFVIFDNETENASVLMDFEAYEKLLGGRQPVEDLSEEELLEKINRDIAIWRSYNEKAEEESEADDAKFIKLMEKEKPEPAVSAPQAQPEPQEPKEIPKIEQKDSTNGEEEEKFYLEPIE